MENEIQEMVFETENDLTTFQSELTLNKIKFSKKYII